MHFNIVRGERALPTWAFSSTEGRGFSLAVGQAREVEEMATLYFCVLRQRLSVGFIFSLPCTAAYWASHVHSSAFQYLGFGLLSCLGIWVLCHCLQWFTRLHDRLLQNLPFMRAGRSLPLREPVKRGCFFTGGSTSVSTLEVLQEPHESALFTFGFTQLNC